MSISSYFSLSSTAWGGAKSVLLTWVLSQTGAIQGVSKAITPIFKGACFFGATTASIEHATTRLKEKVKNSMAEASPYRQGINYIHCAFIIGSRYAVAKLGSQFFGLSVPNKYVHLLTASDIVCQSTSRSKTRLVFIGTIGAICGKVTSIFIKSPLAENAFYCGVINHSICTLLGRVTPFIDSQVKGRVKELRYLFIYRTVLNGLLTSASLYLTSKVCKSLSIDVPRRYLVALMTLNIPPILIYSTFCHLYTDIVSQLSPQQLSDRIKNSKDPNIQKLQAKIQELIDWANPDIDRRPLLEHLVNHPTVRSHVGEVFNFEVAGIFGQFVRSWSKGSSSEGLLVQLVEQLGNQVEDIMPILDIFCEAVGVGSNKEGAQFILKVVLNGASQKILGSFKEMGPQFIPLLLIKSVATYGVETPHAAENLPPFFTEETNGKILALRKELLDSLELRKHYLSVLKHLDTVVKGESTEDFFSFESQLSEEERNALQKLRAIGAGELRSNFIKICVGNALKLLRPVEQEEAV